MTDMLAAQCPYAVNERVCLNERVGTIRYLGPLPDSMHQWAGVEWDDPSHGKHSGEYRGQHYFSCRLPGSGSFVRCDNLPARRTFLQAVKERYAQSDDTEQDIHVQLGTQGVVVETVGWEKLSKAQSQLHRLKVVGLSAQQILTVDAPGDIALATPDIVDLDLSFNLFQEWSVVETICSELKGLCELQVNGICFHSIPAPMRESSAFSNIRLLSLGATRLDWAQACTIGQYMPVLNELIMSKNELTELNTDAATTANSFPQLSRLVLDNNMFTSWDALEPLSSLPRLVHLNVCDNRISSLPESITGFMHLHTLYLRNNCIDNTVMLDRLQLLPALDSLSFQGNPLVHGLGTDQSRTLVIARLGCIRKLNGSLVDREERANCERYYLLQLAREHQGAGDAELARSFSRYEELCREHGPPVLSQLPANAALKDRLLTITVVLRASKQGEDIKRIKKRILGTATVRHLKNLLQRALALPAPSHTIYCVTTAANEEGEMWIQLEDEVREVGFYNVQSGDTLVVMMEDA